MLATTVTRDRAGGPELWTGESRPSLLSATFRLDEEKRAHFYFFECSRILISVKHAAAIQTRHNLVIIYRGRGRKLAGGGRATKPRVNRLVVDDIFADPEEKLAPSDRR